MARQNQHQVVSREFRSPPGQNICPPILTVPQLWIWRFDKWVVSAQNPPEGNHFPLSLSRRLHQKPIINTSGDILSPKRHIALAVVDCIERFGQPSEDGKYPPTLQIFEFGVSRILSDVVEYMDPDRSSKPEIQKERWFLNRISDIQGELAMIQDVLRQQKDILNKIINDPPEDYILPSRRDSGAEYDNWDGVVDATKTLDNYVRLTEKISADAARIEKNIQDELNLKRTFATMDDARTSLLLGIAVIGFTVVTVIFAPLAFMTALFALPIVNLEKSKIPVESGTSSDGTTAFTPGYLGKWFGKCKSRFYIDPDSYKGSYSGAGISRVNRSHSDGFTMVAGTAWKKK